MKATTDGRLHPPTNTPDDHHPQPEQVTINTSVSIPPSSTYNLNITIKAGFAQAEIFLMGPGVGYWLECAVVHATTDSDEAHGESHRESGIAQCYSATYQKQVGDAYLTEKIFDTNHQVALQDAYITGTTLRLVFRNFYGGSSTLNVKGQAQLS